MAGAGGTPRYTMRRAPGTMVGGGLEERSRRETPARPEARPCPALLETPVPRSVTGDGRRCADRGTPARTGLVRRLAAGPPGRPSGPRSAGDAGPAGGRGRACSRRGCVRTPSQRSVVLQGIDHDAESLPADDHTRPALPAVAAAATSGLAGFGISVLFTTPSRSEYNRPLMTIRWTDRDDQGALVAD